MKTNLQDTDISTTTMKMKNDRDAMMDEAPIQDIHSTSDGTPQTTPDASGNFDDTPGFTSDDMAAVSGRSLAEIISDVAEQELAQYPPVSMTPEKLKAMAAKRRAEREAADKTTDGAARIDVNEAGDEAATEAMDRSMVGAVDGATNGTVGKVMDKSEDVAANKVAKKRRTLRIAGLAAVLMLALIGGLLLLNTLTTDVGANKNEKEEIKTEDGVIIEDGGYGASDGRSGNIWSVDDWGEIEAVKANYPQLMIPMFVPNGYEFRQLSIELMDTGDVTCEYLFSNIENEVLEIEQYIQKTGIISLDINDVSRTIESSIGIIHIQEDDTKRATIQLDDGYIRIWYNLQDEELVKLVNSLMI